MSHKWTESDQHTLRELYSTGVGVADIARQIGSTVLSVRQRASALKVYRNDGVCRYCEADLVHPARGRHKTYCDDLCLLTHRTEIEMSEARLRHAAKELKCSQCGDDVPAFRRLYCSRKCGQAAWHRSVWDNPKRKARRIKMMEKNRRAREGR